MQEVLGASWQAQWKDRSKDMNPSAEQQALVAEVATTKRVGQNNINSNKWLWSVP